MHVRAVRTDKITPNSYGLTQLLDTFLPALEEKSVVAITSKVVSICEGRVVPAAGTDKEALIQQESQYHLPSSISQYGYHFTITNHTIIAAAGIDESNANGSYVLWPENSQATANEARRYLRETRGLREIGVVITDSASRPFRLGAGSMALAFSGFQPLYSYIGEQDLFGRPFKVERSDIVDGLATAAGLVMGEGSEQTPIAIIEDIPFVRFCAHDPTEADLATLRITMQDDLFAPFWQTMPWQRGDKA